MHSYLQSRTGAALHALVWLLLTSCCAVLSGTATAQTATSPWPQRPIRLVVPFGAGSTADILARALSASMGRDLGQALVIENRPGAGGTLGAAEVARAQADGYTLVLGTVASHGTGVVMMANVTFDPVRDFQAITLVTNAPSIIVVNRALPVTTLGQLIDHARRSGGLNFSSAGSGTTTHLAGEQLAVLAGVRLTHVPYKAVGQAITDVVSGEIPLMIYQIPSLKPHVDSGSLRAIATTSGRRIDSMPNVPAVAEILHEDFDFNAWFGVLAPAGTARAIVERLHRAILAAMDTAEVRRQMTLQGLEASGLGPDAFQAFVRSELPKWRELVRRSGAVAQ